MAKTASAELLERLVRERHAQLQATLRELDLAIVLENREVKIAKARAASDALSALKSTLAVGDQPAWIRSLERELNRYIGGAARDQESGRKLVDAFMKLRPAIDSQRWSFAADDAGAIDFASVYDHYYSQSRIPDLFDQLVTQLEQVIASGEVDSVKTVEALERLIATVRANARGDIFSAYWTAQFSRAFLRNFLIAVLEEIPGLKTLVKALKETAKELDTEIDNTQSLANVQLVEMVKSALPVPFDYQPPALPAAGETGDSQRAP